VLKKEIAGAEKNSEKGIVPPSSAIRVRWDHFEAQMNRLLFMETVSIASSRFNRIDFIRGLQRYLEATPFFNTVSLSEGEMSLEQQKSFHLKINLMDFEMSSEFLSQLKNHEDKGKTDQEIKAKIKEFLTTLLMNIEKEFTAVQSVRVDPVSKLFNTQHFEDWLWYQNNELQNAPNDRLNFFMINMDAFASINDYFSHGAGDTVLQNVGVALTELRHQLHGELNIAYDQIGIHRHLGPNFVLSVRTQEGQEINLENILSKLKNKIENKKHPLEWDWNVNKTAVFDMQEDSVVEIVRQLKNNGDGKIDLNRIPRYRKSDSERKNILKGLKINLGHFQYPAEHIPVAKNLTAKELSQVINQSLIYINNLKKENPEWSDFVYLSDKEYFEQIKKFIDNQRTDLNEENRWALQFVKKWNQISENINDKRSIRKYSETHNLFEKIVNQNKKSPSRKDIENSLLENFKKAFEEKDVKIVSFNEILKRSALQNKLNIRYRPVYQMGSKYYFPVMDRSGHIHYLYELKPKKKLTTNQVIKIVQEVFKHDVVYTQFIKKSKNDKLTGLPNRQAFESDFEAEFRKNFIGLGAFDLNSFSGFTQTFGLLAGDMVIKTMAEKLDEIAKENGVRLYRFGGEEFELLASDMNRLQATMIQMKEAMEQWPNDSESWQYTISWNQIKENLKSVMYSVSPKDFAELEEAYLKQVQPLLKGKPFDPDQAFSINLLKMPRYVFKKKLNTSGLSFSVGLTPVMFNAQENLQHFLNEVDKQAHSAKILYDLHRPSGGVIVKDDNDISKNK